jgi:nitroimidazol reductase NimA-like FMN-containing flavoprotein (pyridoxamine 5'-phosphate oxidase superfamily)
MSIRLTQDEAWAEIDRSHTGILTTLRADGSPITLPVWFVTLDRAICFATPRRTKKVTRIARDPRGSFLIESGRDWAELRGVHVSGRIEPVEDESVKALIDAGLAAKYAAFRTAPSDMPEATRAYYASRCFFRLVPDPRILSWDNSRIAGTGPA